MDNDPDHSPPRKRARTSEDSTPSAFPLALPPPDAAFLAANDARLEHHQHQHRHHHQRLPSVGMAPFLMMSLRGRTDGAHVASATIPAHGSLEATVSGDEPMGLAMRLHNDVAQANAAEESTTDDEELQQLSMVKLDEGAAFETGELNYDDVKTVVFSAAKDPRLSTLQKSMRMIKMASNGAEVMRRLVQAEDETGLTLLMIGVKNNLLPFCGFLLDEGADVNYNSEKRTYALLLAAQKGWEEMTKFLLDRGANDESKNMSLIPAAHFGHLSVVTLLLECGADLNYANKKGTTPLMRAAQEGRENVVQFFIHRGVDTCAANVRGSYTLANNL